MRTVYVFIVLCFIFVILLMFNTYLEGKKKDKENFGAPNRRKVKTVVRTLDDKSTIGMFCYGEFQVIFGKTKKQGSYNIYFSDIPEAYPFVQTFGLLLSNSDGKNTQRNLEGLQLTRKVASIYAKDPDGAFFIWGKI